MVSSTALAWQGFPPCPFQYRLHLSFGFTPMLTSYLAFGDHPSVRAPGHLFLRLAGIDCRAVLSRRWPHKAWALRGVMTVSPLSPSP